MTVKRYTPTQCCEHDGTYVTYSDYQKLVAENAALKKFIVDECVIPHEFYGDNKDAADFMPATPNTDAAIAEIESVGAEKVFNLVEPAVRNFCNPEVTGFVIEELESLAANLRAGRKG